MEIGRPPEPRTRPSLPTLHIRNASSSSTVSAATTAAQGSQQTSRTTRHRSNTTPGVTPVRGWLPSQLHAAAASLQEVKPPSRPRALRFTTAEQTLLNNAAHNSKLRRTRGHLATTSAPAALPVHTSRSRSTSRSSYHQPPEGASRSPGPDSTAHGLSPFTANASSSPSSFGTNLSGLLAWRPPEIDGQPPSTSGSPHSLNTDLNILASQRPANMDSQIANLPSTPQTRADGMSSRAFLIGVPWPIPPARTSAPQVLTPSPSSHGSLQSRPMTSSSRDSRRSTGSDPFDLDYVSNPNSPPRDNLGKRQRRIYQIKEAEGF